MAFHQLAPELWIHILSYLATPLPKPLSGLTQSEALGESPEYVDRLPVDGAPGTTSRGDIRSPDLANCMRCCVAMNQYAAPILYHRVITDDLGLLLFNHRAWSAHARIDSKGTLLRHIVHLHLEYARRIALPTYLHLVYDGGTIFDFVGRPSMQYTCVDASMEEQQLSVALPEVPYIFGGKTAHIRTITVGAIFGGQDAVWRRIAPGPNEPNDDNLSVVSKGIADCRVAALHAFRSLPITHYCQRGSSGPLSLPPVFIWYDQAASAPTPTIPLFTCHFDGNTPLVPAAVGHPTRWLFEEHLHPIVLQSILREAMSATGLAQYNAAYLSEEVKRLAHALPKTILDLGIWASSDGKAAPPADPTLQRPPPARERFTAEEERKLSADLGGDLVKVVRKREVFGGRGVACKDDVVLHSSLDSPCCEACHWELERAQA